MNYGLLFCCLCLTFTFIKLCVFSIAAVAVAVEQEKVVELYRCCTCSQNSTSSVSYLTVFYVSVSVCVCDCAQTTHIQLSMSNESNWRATDLQLLKLKNQLMTESHRWISIIISLKFIKTTCALHTSNYSLKFVKG